MILLWGDAFKLFDSSNIKDNNETVYCIKSAKSNDNHYRSYDISNGSDISSKILPIFLRLIAVSVYTVAVDSKSFVEENNDASMLFTLKYLVCYFKICLLIFAHAELS